MCLKKTRLGIADGWGGVAWSKGVLGRRRRTKTVPWTRALDYSATLLRGTSHPRDDHPVRSGLPQFKFSCKYANKSFFLKLQQFPLHPDSQSSTDPVGVPGTSLASCHSSLAEIGGAPQPFNNIKNYKGYKKPTLD